MRFRSYEEISSVMRYDQYTGNFFWRKRTGGTSNPGAQIDGHLTKKGYIHIGVLGSIYGAHRLAWLLVNGDWPKNEIDHINGDKKDNRIINLRDVDRTTNQQNKKIANANNKNGILGVYEIKPGKWRARIWHENKNKSLGVYSSKEQASNAYIEAKRCLHKGCTI